jgi:hypothetical protein
LYVCLFAITIRQTPYNESLFECVFLMVITGTMTVSIAWESSTWIGSGSAVVWIGGVYFVVVGLKGEVTKQYYNFVEPIAKHGITEASPGSLAFSIWSLHLSSGA